MIGMTTGLTVIVLILVVSLTICMVAIAATCRRYYVSQMKKEILSLESFPVEAKGSEVAKRRDFPTRGHHHKKWTSQHMLRMSSVQTLDVEWEMNFSLLQLKEKLGSGAFGSVYKAVVADDTTVLESSVVAVKLLRGKCCLWVFFPFHCLELCLASHLATNTCMCIHQEHMSHRRCTPI